MSSRSRSFARSWRRNARSRPWPPPTTWFRRRWGGWVAKYKKKHAEDQDPEAAAESAEIARLKAENRELRAEMRVLEKNGCLLRERTSVSERHRAHPPRRRQLPRRLHVANWSEYRSPATCDWLSRPEAATKVRRRKLALLVESEFKASDMILRVPAPRRRPEAQGHRRVPRHASAPLMREKGPVSRWAAPEGPHHHPRRRHRHPPRPGGQGLPPPRPPGSNGSGTSPTSAWIVLGVVEGLNPWKDEDHARTQEVPR